MGTLSATDGLGRGIDMSASGGTTGYFADGGANSTITYVGALDDYTLSYSITGLNTIHYMTISGVVQSFGLSMLVYDIGVYDANFGTLAYWDDINISISLINPPAVVDLQQGVGGADLISGNSFADTLRAGDGNDTLYGGSGYDLLSGAGADDLIYGNKDVDLISGGSGNDTIFGGQNSGAPSGGEGSSGDGTLRQRDGVETIFGNDGNDVIYGNYGSELLLGGNGDDRLFGGQDNDTLSGGEGADTLYGNRGDDVLVGGNGADVFVLTGTGTNQVTDFNGAAGDLVDVAAPSAISIQTSGSGNVFLVVNPDLTLELVGVTSADFSSGWII